MYDFLQETPKNIIVAGHPYETNCVSLYTKRAVFTSYEALSPEYSRYYNIIKNRTDNFFMLFYSTDKQTITNICEKNNITYLLVDYKYFNKENVGFIPPFNEIIIGLTKNKTNFILNNISDEYKIINNPDYYLIQCEDLKYEK